MLKKYTNEEIEYLKNNHGKGVMECTTQLNRSKKGIIKKLKKLGLLVVNSRLKYTKEDIVNLLNTSNSIREVASKMGSSTSSNGNYYRTIYKYCKEFCLDEELKNLRGRELEGRKNRMCDIREVRSLESILVENSTYNNRSDLKKKLFKENLLKNECYMCGNGEIWFGVKISLVLDHINGIWNDNRIENLRILCPNCHATTPTYCRKKQYGNVDRKDDVVEYFAEKYSGIIERKNYYCECGEEKDRRAKMCLTCYRDKNNRKVKDRPPLEDLLLDIDKLGYSATGRKYNVSDNTIRKWVTDYKK